MTLAINLAFHRIVNSRKHIESDYDIDQAQLHDILAAIKSLGRKNGVALVRAYFDDNDVSVLTTAQPVVAAVDCVGICAVPVESIGREGCCTLANLASLSGRGFGIVPHG